MAIYSYLTPVTGLKEGDLDDAASLPVVLQELGEILHPRAILVGQAIENDLLWLGLEQNVHYQAAIDLAQLFKTERKHYTCDLSDARSSYLPRFFYSLQHAASVLLGEHSVDLGASHDPRVDAHVSMDLYLRYGRDEHACEAAKQLLATSKAPVSVAKNLDYQCDGVCMAAYNAAKCKCGALTK